MGIVVCFRSYCGFCPASSSVVADSCHGGGLLDIDMVGKEMAAMMSMFARLAAWTILSEENQWKI